MYPPAETILGQYGPWLSVVLGGIALLIARLYSQGSKSKYPLPPGPKGVPLLGNFRQIPAERSDIYFAKLGEEYKSDILYFNLFGQHAIVLNSVKAAADLLDKKGAIYSERPSFKMLESLGFNNNLALVGGAQFRKIRKAYNFSLSSSRSNDYRDLQEKHAIELADELEQNPEKWLAKLSRFATKVIMNVGFGIEPSDEEDPFFKLADEVGEIISSMGNFGLTIVDVLPWIVRLPRWIGNLSPSVKFVHDSGPIIQEFLWRPLNAVKESVRAGTAKRSVLGDLVRAKEAAKEDEEQARKKDIFTEAELRGSCGNLYSAGQDTTFSTETTFVMAMVLNPEVQARAQKEIDAVTGGTRLPTFDDWSKIPVVERLVYETLRFHAVVPNGVPHQTAQEDVYRGMYIPKGATIIANAYAMLHDPNTYKDPFTFNPDRYLPVAEGGLGEPLPIGHFGFGRRICPGQYIALASVWIVIAVILAKFTITPGKDKDGKVILPRYEFTTGVTSHAVPFSAVFTKRKDL